MNYGEVKLIATEPYGCGEQIAQKYKDEDAIAGYGLLNEPWGASPKVMSEFGIDLYHAVRRYDDEHIDITWP